MNIKMFILAEDLQLVNGIWQKKPNTLIMKPANSLMKQFLQAIKTQFSYVSCGTSAWTDTGGVARSVSPGGLLDVRANANDATLGIVAGTGTNAVTISDYALQTQIAHGTGAGQLSYAAVLFPNTNVTVDGSNCYYDFNRTFTNSSVGSITINEIGLYSNTTYKFMLDRTLYTKTIANGAGAIITYRIQISV